MQETISERIKLLSVVCTLFVIYRHSYTCLAFYGQLEQPVGYNSTIQDYFSILTQVAVPFFFTVSGYFFAKYNYYHHGEYMKMVQKKWKTLIIPFILWNIICVPFYLAKYRKELDEITFLLSFVEADSPLWYVRDLILFMLLSLVYYWLTEKKFIVLQFIVLVVLFWTWQPVDTSIMSSEGMFFFFLGILLKRYDVKFNDSPNIVITISLTVIWIIFCVCPEYASNTTIMKIRTIFGLSSVWFMSYYIKGKVKDCLLSISRYSFFIYAGHYYFVKIIKYQIGYFFFGNELAACLSFMLIPVLTFYILLGFSKLLEKTQPQLYNYLTGYR